MKLFVFAAIAIFLIFLSQSVYGIGISPSFIDIRFEPNTKHLFNYTVIGSEKNVSALIYVRGNLSDYIILDKKNVSLLANGREKFSAELRLPSKLEPGRHIAWVGVVEVPAIEEPLGARAGVESILTVRVPYPGKYIEIDFNAPNIVVGETANFKIKVFNYGSENVRAKAVLNISKIPVSDIPDILIWSEEKFVPVDSTDVLEINWTTDKPGRYRAIATVNYDENRITAEKNFKVGNFYIDITSINTTIKDVMIFDVELESFWNKNINATINVQLIKNNVTVVSNETNVTVEQWSLKKIPIYINTEKLVSGDYNAKISLYYDGKETKKIIGVEIKAEYTWIFIVIIVIIALIAFVCIKKAGKWSKEK